MEEKIKFSHSGSDIGRSPIDVRMPWTRAIGGAAALRCKSDAPISTIVRRSESRSNCWGRLGALSTQGAFLDAMARYARPRLLSLCYRLDAVAHHALSG